MAKTKVCKVVALYPPSFCESALCTSYRTMMIDRLKKNAPETVLSSRIGNTNSPQSVEEWEECIKLLFNGELNVDPGEDLEVDVHLVWHEEKGIKDYESIKAFIHSFEGRKINKGTITLHTQKNPGNGFAALEHVLTKHKEDYDYWCYQEDDHYIIDSGKGYLRTAVDQIKSTDNASVVCFSPFINYPLGVANKYVSHFGGMYGLFHKSKLFPETFPHDALVCGQGSSFEPAISKWIFPPDGASPLECMPLKGFSNIPRSWKLLDTYEHCVENQTIYTNNIEPFFFSVGLEV